MEIIYEIVELNVDVLLFMEECISLGNWWIAKEHFDISFSIQDTIYAIWEMARKYLDEGLDSCYLAIMLTLKDMIIRFGPR